MGEYGGTQCEPQPAGGAAASGEATNKTARRGAEIVGAPVLGEYGGHFGAPVTK